MNEGALHVMMTTDAIGGVWQYSVELARALAGLGCEIQLVVVGPPVTAAQRATIASLDGVTLVETELPLDWLADTWEQVADAAEAVATLACDLGADVLHLNQPSLAASPNHRTPVVAVAHSCLATWWGAVRTGPLPADFTWRTRWFRHGLEAADRVVCPSEAFADMTWRTYGLSVMPCLVHNGRTPPAPSSLVPPSVTADVITAGRLWDAGKNIKVLDGAAGKLQLHIAAAGSTRGPNGETFRCEHLRTVGQLDEGELGACFARQPIFVSSALYEPFGLAVLEAAAAGCPLVLSDIPTFRELWDDAATFFDPASPDQLSEAVARLIDDREVRRTQGDRARVRAQCYSPQRMAAGMLDVYRSVCPAASERARVHA